MTALPPIFSCVALHAKLTVKACGARHLTVRSSPKGSAGFDSACENCPIGAHHAKHGTLFPGKEYTEPMAPPPKWTEEQQRAAVRRVIVGQEKRAAVARDIGVTATSITNWCNRFEAEIAREEVDRVGAEPDTKPVADVPRRKTREAPEREHLAEPEEDVEIVVARAVRALLRAREGSRDACAALGALGANFAMAVGAVDDKRERGEVADAAWALSRAAKP